MNRIWMGKTTGWIGAVALAFGLVAALVPPGCSDESEPLASARVVARRADLVGGQRALGEVGDYLLENDKIRVIIQGPGFSRGFGVFGGSIIDADLRRPEERGDSRGGTGNDALAELFPAFFLQAVWTDTVSVRSDGSDGGPARVVASGYGGDFLTTMGVINRAATGSYIPDVSLTEAILDQNLTEYAALDAEPTIRYESSYELLPGQSHVAITFQVTNVSEETLSFPGKDAEFLLGFLGLPLEGFTLPVGDVALFGGTCPVFLPGVGFNTRFGLFDAYEREVEWPGFPGMTAEWVACAGDDISYGIFLEPTDDNFLLGKRELYEDGRTPITPSSVLIPFEASGFLGIFYANAPSELPPGESFRVTKYFIVGDGDVGGVLDVMHELQGIAVGRIGGRVLDRVSGQPAEDAEVLVYQRFDDGLRRIYSQYDVRAGGQFTGTLPPGAYSARVAGEGRRLSDFVDFAVTAGNLTNLPLTANSPGRIVVTVVDPHGQRLPAKVSVVGRYDPAQAGRTTREFLFDLEAGEPYRFSDGEPDDPNDPDTLRYLEATEPTRDGMAELLVRPGRYQVVISRGLEYETQTTTVSVAPGDTVSVSGTLERAVDTRGWIAADMHMHTINSIDSAHPVERQVRLVAAEGIEWAVSTDHNYVTDFAPTIAAENLQDWLVSSVGLELSTLESGHFNGYPLEYAVGNITHGSFEWSLQRPQTIFDNLRSIGAYGPEETIVQVNHPRDTIQGYMQQYRRDALTGEYVEPDLLGSAASPNGPAFYLEDGESAFSLDFDAFEVVNGKIMEQIHHYRVPEVLPEGELPDEIPPAGTILLDSDDQVAYPGMVDDWYNLLNLGHRFIAVGTSDSHHDAMEPGYARTMVRVANDDPSQVTELELVHALRSRHAVVTTGPMLDFWINDPVQGEMGRTVVDSDGLVTVHLRMTAAPWLRMDRINIVRNGLIAAVLEEGLGPDRDLAAHPFEAEVEVPLATDDDGNPIDSWFVVEAVSAHSMFPVVRPQELPPLVLSDAVGSVGAAFGFGGDEYGDLKPERLFPIVPYGLTNPVWVTTDEGEFDPPGPIPLIVRTAAENDPGLDPRPEARDLWPFAGWAGRDLAGEYARPVGAASPVARPAESFVFQRDPDDIYDVRLIFETFAH